MITDAPQSSPLPLCHCPPGVTRPPWCPPVAPFGRLAEAGGGICWNGPWRDGQWTTHPAGWSVLLDGHKPQHLVRVNPHPRILSAVAVAGAEPDQLWLVPVLLRPVLRTAAAELYEPALDRVWRDGAWQTPVELGLIVQGLLDLATRPEVAAAEDVEARNAQLARVAIQGLTLTHHIDEQLLDLTGWMTEAVLGRVVRAMSGLTEDVVPC